MIIVTGGAGFIGSNLVKALNQIGRRDIIVIDDLRDGSKFRNLADVAIEDYLDKDEFRQLLNSGDNKFGRVDTIFHEGACSDTTEWDGRFMLDNNYRYAKEVLHYCMQHKIPLIYASSAAVYGRSDEFSEQASCEKPLNIYAYSKLLFDNYVRQLKKSVDNQIVGLRYFNVYGPGEAHKGDMASIACQLNAQLLDNGRLKLFEGCDGYSAGEQQRDFIHVDDAVAINLWFMQRPRSSGIFNVGSGKSRSFNDVAKAVIEWHGCGEIDYIPFPAKLTESYQSFTRADLTGLRGIGCEHQFKTLEAGMKEYLAWLNDEKT